MTVQDPKLTDGVVTESQDGKTTEPENKTQDGADTKPTNAEPENKVSNTKETAIGLIQKAESFLKEGKELPKDLMWTLPHIDTDNLKVSEPSKEESKEELVKEVENRVRQQVEFENLQKNLPEDLDEDTAEKLNSIIEREMGYGKSSIEALKYAAYECGVPFQREKSQEELIGDAHRFPRIKPRTAKPKNNLVKTNIDAAYVKMLKDQYGVEIS